MVMIWLSQLLNRVSLTGFIEIDCVGQICSIKCHCHPHCDKMRIIGASYLQFVDFLAAFLHSHNVWCCNTCDTVSSVLLLQLRLRTEPVCALRCKKKKGKMFLSQPDSNRWTHTHGASHIGGRCRGNNHTMLTGVQRSVVVIASCSCSHPLFQSFESTCWVSGWCSVLSLHRAKPCSYWQKARSLSAIEADVKHYRVDKHTLQPGPSHTVPHCRPSLSAPDSDLSWCHWSYYISDSVKQNVNTSVAGNTWKTLQIQLV